MGKLCRNLVTIILIFCCILPHIADLYADLRYVRIYIDETSYAVIDLGVVVGIMMLFLFFVLARESHTFSLDV